jgi:prepilin-type N-terminal cleavage/methylation domain-containing protein
MKTNPRVESRESRVESRARGAFRFSCPRPSSLVSRRAFTLIELLVVIAIMGTLAALLFPVVGAVKRQQYLHNARAEMAQLQAAIDNYKTTYGFYPPGNQLNPANPLVNPLYYELTGTTNLDVNNPSFQSLDNPALTPLPAAQLTTIFGSGGFVNCSKPNGGEESSAARNFLPSLKPAQVWNNFTNAPANVGVTLLISSVGGPNPTYQPLGQPDLNPWRYNSSNPTNNPGSYELWVQLVIGRQTNLICNWTKQVQINSPLP